VIDDTMKLIFFNRRREIPDVQKPGLRCPPGIEEGTPGLHGFHLAAGALRTV